MEIIRLKLHTGNCKVTSSLSRTMGQYQVNTKKFCDKFNVESSQKIINNILFYIFVFKQDKEVYQIKLGNHSLKFILHCFLQEKNNKNYSITIVDLYDIYRIYKQLSMLDNVNIKNFFGSLSSFTNLYIKN